jgi:hypothetical protein
MSQIECTCDDPSFGHVGRPNCIITQKALAFPMFSPRNRANGNRNFLPANAAGIVLFNAEYGTTETTLQGCVDYRLAASTPALDALYPGLRVESATFERTDTQYETAASGRKVKLDGVGGIRTWTMELWGDDAAFGVARAYKKFGCSDLDVFYVDVAGANWGIQDVEGDGKVRGYEMSTETFDQFISYTTDTTSQKINLSWDLDAFECEENAWAITADEYGKKFTSIRPLIQGISVLDVAASTLVAAAIITVVVKLNSSFGTAGNKQDIVGLLNANFTLLDSVGADEVAAGAWTSVTENPNGTYTLVSPAVVAAGDYSLVSAASGYSVPNVSVVVA